VRIIETLELSQENITFIQKLWNQEYPKKLCYDGISDFEKYLLQLKGQKHYLLVDDSDNIKGWGVIFERDAEKWFAIILDNSIHGLGYGTKLLNKLKEKEEKLSGWVIDHYTGLKQNGEYYMSPLNFYQKNGFDIKTGIRLELEKISAVKIEWSF